MSISVLYISLGGHILANDFNGSLERQKKCAKLLNSFHVIERIKHGDKIIQDLSFGNLYFYPTEINNCIQYFWKCIELGEEIIKNHQIDCIICDDPSYTGLSAIYLAKKYSLPLNISVRSDLINNIYYIQENFLKNLAISLINKQALYQATSIRVSTLFEQQKLNKFYGNRINSIPFCINQDYYADLEKSSKKEMIKTIRQQILSKCDGNYMVLCVARLAKQKRIDILIKSAKKVIHAFPKTVFCIVGDGQEYTKLNSLVKHLNLQNNVKFVGNIEYKNIHLYFKACDLFVMTSQHEGNCMSLLHAATAGKAVVSTKFAGALDLLKEFEDSALCEINNYQDIADKIIYAIMNREHTKYMGDKLRKKVLNEFDYDTDIQKSVQQWINMVAQSNK